VNEESLRKFQSVARELESKRERGKRLAVDCMKVMDGIVRPALRMACQEVESRDIQCNEGSAMITVWAGHRERGTARITTLEFNCELEVLYISKDVGNGTIKDAIDIENVSEELVVDKITGFLREALGLM
jgi:hypothetical protein